MVMGRISLYCNFNDFINELLCKIIALKNILKKINKLVVGTKLHAICRHNLQIFFRNLFQFYEKVCDFMSWNAAQVKSLNLDLPVLQMLHMQTICNPVLSMFMTQSKTTLKICIIYILDSIVNMSLI